MYLRRLRTLMDQLLQPSSTPYAQCKFEQRIDQLVAQIEDDVVADRTAWGWYGANQDLNTAIQILKNDYLNVRRFHLYRNHLVGNPESIPTGTEPTGEQHHRECAGIPYAQPDSITLNIQIDQTDLVFNPISGNQDEEYIKLLNNEPNAVDISGFKLTGAVNFTFPPATVLGTIANVNELYISPNVVALRNRTTSPTGTENRFVIGNYNGHLSSWGETINLLDADNNLIDSFTYTGNPSDQQRYLRITEIMYHPHDPCQPSPYHDEDFEFIEIKNIGPVPINLNSVMFTDGINFTFPPLDIDPNAYLVLVKDHNAFAERYPDIPAGVPVLGPYDGQLSNGGEKIKLEDDCNSTILEFDYQDSWYPITDGFGFSLTIIDPCNPDPDSWDQKASWRPSASLGGSPGQDDTGQLPNPGSVVINELLAHSPGGTPDWIELHNTTDQTINIGSWFLSDSDSNFAKYQIQTGTIIEPGGYFVFYEDPNFGNPSDPGCHTPFALSENGETVYLSSGQDGQLTGYQEVQKFGPSETNVSCGRYTKSTADVDFVAMASNTPGSANAYPKIGPIIITEIMYHPKGDPNTDAEYVELYNITADTINLFDAETNPWKFEDDDDPGIDYLFPTDANIPPYSFLLLVKNMTAFNAAAYPSVPPSVQILEWGGGKLANGGDKIKIAMPGDLDNGQRQYIRIDSVDYDDQPPWPTEPDGTGSSLTRIYTQYYANDPNNWQAATPTPGK